jgi:hypothetical protein
LLLILGFMKQLFHLELWPIGLRPINWHHIDCNGVFI